MAVLLAAGAGISVHGEQQRVRDATERPPQSLVASWEGSCEENVRRKGSCGAPWTTEQGLIDHEAKICMGWTARAACTFAVSIFFEKLGLLDKALAYHPMVHNYRNDVLDQRFVASAEDCAGPGVTAFKIVRNPFARATSSFGHQMHSEFSLNPQMRWVMTTAMGQTDLRHVSFVQWLRAIRNVTFSPLDIHSWPQATMPERNGQVVFDPVCKLEDELEACLGAVNRRTGANFSLTRAAETSASHNVEHQEVSGDVANRPYGSFPKASEGYSGRGGARAFPEPSDFYRGPSGAEAAALVVELYKVDFALYKYSTTDPTGIGVVSEEAGLERVVKRQRERQDPAVVA